MKVEYIRVVVQHVIPLIPLCLCRLCNLWETGDPWLTCNGPYYNSSWEPAHMNPPALRKRHRGIGPVRGLCGACMGPVPKTVQYWPNLRSRHTRSVYDTVWIPQLETEVRAFLLYHFFRVYTEAPKSYTRLENLAWSHPVFWQFIFCRKCRFMKPLLLSSVDTFCKFTSNIECFTYPIPLPLNFLRSFLTLLLLKPYFIYKMAIEDHNNCFITSTFCRFEVVEDRLGSRYTPTSITLFVYT